MDFKDSVQKIKSQYNIVDYIKRNGVALETAGNGSWKGLCPFHSENTPSFIVSEDFQNYRCFGCGEAGDILSFAQHTHTITFVESLKMLAEEKGIELEIRGKTDEPSHDINGIRKVIQDAQAFFRENYEALDETHPAKQEVIKRGLDVNNELYGYSLEAPNRLYEYLREAGHSDENIKDSNLVIFFDDRAPWDFFHGRLMITLSDYLGRPVSFTSRKIYDDDRMKGKYVNGKESPVFIKKSMLFGADVAKRTARTEEKVYVVEGQFDQIAMVEKGIDNVVATSGTAFTDEHANLLLRMVGNSGEIVFVMDGDEAGSEAATKIFTSYPVLHSKAHAVHLENGKDPCDYIVEGGVDNLINMLEKSTPLHDFIINYVLTELSGVININNRQQFVSTISRYAKYTNDQYISDSMLNKASVISAVSIDNVRDIYNKTDVTQAYSRPAEKTESKQLNPEIKLNLNNEADKCMFTALSLLVRMPSVLIESTPKTIHNKFKPFMRELGEVYSQYSKEDKDWRFIAEEYTDVDFAKALQGRNFLGNPRDNEESTKSQYEYLFNKANEIYMKEFEEMRRAKALSSVVDSTDPQEIAEALRLYKESQ